MASARTPRPPPSGGGWKTTVSTLMGKKPELRFAYIQENALHRGIRYLGGLAFLELTAFDEWIDAGEIATWLCFGELTERVDHRFADEIGMAAGDDRLLVQFDVFKQQRIGKPGVISLGQNALGKFIRGGGVLSVETFRTSSIMAMSRPCASPNEIASLVAVIDVADRKLFKIFIACP